MKSAREVFLQFLQRQGMTMTPQRATIVEVFLHEEGHFSPEQLYMAVNKADPAIGQATVYRTLKLLTDSGLAATLDMGDGATLYEHGYGHAHHDHLICVRCGGKTEIVDHVIEERQERIAEKHGFELTRHSMLLYGVCPRCRGKRGGSG
ncbi:MAG: Fur family transcriptional regulator [Desulfovibrio sp.]|nr:Fur family transcriptional regulator [Desulfovibrio sp.]